VWSNVIAGAVLGGTTLQVGTISLLMVAVSLFYIGGMFLNDAFDRGIDAKERPERPIPSGEISASQVFAAGFALLASGSATAMWAASSQEGVAAVSVLGTSAALAAAIVLYDMAHKGNRAAPLIMGGCRGLVYLLAAIATGGDVGAVLGLPAVALLFYVAGLTYVAAQENLREVKNLWPIALLSAPILLATPQLLDNTAVLVFSIALAAWTAAAVARIAGEGPRDVPGTVTRLIAGISLVDAVAIAAVGSTDLAAIAALGLIATRLFQRTIPGT
jgi:4-hydroxybenzoate polyprenyltransferase